MGVINSKPVSYSGGGVAWGGRKWCSWFSMVNFYSKTLLLVVVVFLYYHGLSILFYYWSIGQLSGSYSYLPPSLINKNYSFFSLIGVESLCLFYYVT